MKAAKRRPSAVAFILMGALFAAVSGALPAGASDDVKVVARLEPQTISPAGVAVLTLEISSGGFGRLRAVPRFEVENFADAGAPSRSESFEFINGASRRSLTLTWRLRPLANGPARVHGVRVEMGGQTIELPDLSATVDPKAPAPGPAAGSSPFPLGDPLADLFGARARRRGGSAVMPKVFLRATIAPERVVAGEQAVYTVYLYTQGDVSGIQPTSVPRFERFWSRDIPQPDRPRAEMVEIEGERYGQVVLLQRALFPLRAGAAPIEPLAADIAVRLPSADPWGRLVGQIANWRRESNAVELAVDPLPPAPPEFSGAVGRLKLDATLDRREVPMGEAATLTVSVSGPGRLGGIAAPALPRLEGVRVFPPDDDGADELRGTSVVGRRTWRYVLVPEVAAIWQVPPISLTYFDPVAKAYRAAASRPLELAATPAATTAASETTTPIAPVTPEETAARSPQGARTGWALTPWILAAGFGLALLVVLVRRRDGGGRPAPFAPALAERLEGALREERAGALAGAVEEVWRTELERRHALPATTPPTQWAAKLGANGLPADVVEEFRRLADDLHYLRYAPQLASTDVLRDDLAARSRRLASLI